MIKVFYDLKEDIGFLVGVLGMFLMVFFYDLKVCVFFVLEVLFLYKCDICFGKVDLVKDEINKFGII